MSNLCVISSFNERPTFLREEDGRAVEFFYDSETEFNLNSIVLGKISNVSTSINACFVELKPGVKGFISIDSMDGSLLCNREFDGKWKQNDEILVQIVSLPQKNKPYSLSMKLSITGRFVVSTYEKTYGYSSKLSSVKKKEIASSINTLNTVNGFIFRTSCDETPLDLVLREFIDTDNILTNIVNNKDKRTVFSVLYQGIPFYLKRIVESKAEKIITDIEDIYDNLSFYPFLKGKLEFFDNKKVPLSLVHKFSSVYNEATNKKVNLPCGGYIIIEPTEALTVIDVNSGKCDIKKNKDVVIDIINREAAVEISRQLMLRNLSGIIIIDFINSTEKDLLNLTVLLKKLLKEDIVKSKFIDITPLGLCEITRQKTYNSGIK